MECHIREDLDFEGIRDGRTSLSQFIHGSGMVLTTFIYFSPTFLYIFKVVY